MYKIKAGVGSVAIDYGDIGQRIKQKRIEKGLTQDKLSEIVGIGPSHMSHIESGSTVPSFDVFVAIINALDCSADELLCREIYSAKPLCNNWLTNLLDDCDSTEIKILSDTLICLKNTLRKHKSTE